MKHSIYILLMLSILLNGCQGYIGGLDDSNVQIVQLVFMNRSSHDIELIVKDPCWSEEPDTIRLEKGNGLWKHDFGSEYTYTNHFFDEAEIVVDGKERFLFEDTNIPYSPCSLNPLNDSKGVYYVYDFNEKAYAGIKKAFEDLRTFVMTDMPPSYIVHDTLITAGSSEALFRTLFPAPSVRKSLKLGSVVGKEAEGIDMIRIYEEDGIAPGQVETDEEEYSGGRKDSPYISYYSLEELSQIGLAHFGCDFGELTGRKDMDRFCGCIYSSVDIRRRETLQDSPETSEFMMNLADGKAVVKSITYGNVRLLLAEADCMHRKLMNYLYFNVLTDTERPNLFVPDVKYYLLSLDENGSFRCKSGGVEIVNEYLDESGAGPTVAIDYSLADSTGSAYVHIHNIFD
jgi:hypothetical protein